MGTVCVPGPLTQLARRHGFARSPLHRGTDRVEAAATAVTAVLALLAMLLATIIAIGSYQRATIEAATKATHQASVTAVLLSDADVPAASSSRPGAVVGSTALARWPLPDGQQHTAPLWVSANRHAGDRISIWIDQHGNRVDPPKTPSSMITDAVAYGIVLLVGAWALLGSLWWALCRVLGRVNAARWDLEWARTEPRWSRRSWQ